MIQMLGYSFMEFMRNFEQKIFQYFSDCYCDNTLDRSSSSRCSKRCTKYSGTDLEKFYFCGSGSNRDISTVYHTDGMRLNSLINNLR